MKKLSLLLLLPAVIVMFLFSSCDENGTLPPEISLSFGLSVSGETLENNGSYSFGLIKTETSETISVTLTNTGDADLTVNSAELSGSPDFILEAPSLPFSFASGTSEDLSLTFGPQTSGEKSAALSLTVEGIDEVFKLNLAGVANYPPEILFGIEVSDAGNSAANGFYDRTGFKNEGSLRRPFYTLNNETKYYCYLFDYSDGWMWGIDGSPDAGYPVIAEYWCADGNSTMVPPADSWQDNSGERQPPAVQVLDISGTTAETIQPLTAAYRYFDADSDAEDTGNVSYQWYRSAAEDGTYDAIEGAVSKDYTPLNDEGYYLRVEITTRAVTGITEAVSVMSSPTIQIVSGELLN